MIKNLSGPKFAFFSAKHPDLMEKLVIIFATSSTCQSGQ